jgi:hypothetical protein
VTGDIPFVASSTGCEAPPKEELALHAIYCSDYLEQQETTYRAAAEDALAVFSRRPGFWSLIQRMLFGAGRRERLERREHELAERYYTAEADAWERSRAGEDALDFALRQHLDNRYLLLRNYTPPAPWHKGGDIDAVLLGPHGVTVFEVKAWRGMFLVQGGDWYRRVSPYAPWLPTDANPTTQARANADRIHETLRDSGIDSASVQPIVAVGSPDMFVDLHPPLATYIFYACRPNARPDTFLKPSHGHHRLPPAVLSRVYAALAPSIHAGALSQQ